MACMSRYSDAFKKSFTTVIRHAQHAMKYRRLCASVPAAAYSIALRPSAIKLVAISNMVYNVASLYHHLYSPEKQQQHTKNKQTKGKCKHTYNIIMQIQKTGYTVGIIANTGRISLFDWGKQSPIYFGTNVACSGCFFKVISTSDLADLSISLLNEISDMYDFLWRRTFGGILQPLYQLRVWREERKLKCFWHHLSYSLLQDQPLLVLWKGPPGKMHGRQGGGWPHHIR